MFNGKVSLGRCGHICNASYAVSSDARGRYSVMIEMNLSHEGLEAFDASEVHQEWKNTYGDRLESKAIFDCD